MSWFFVESVHHVKCECDTREKAGEMVLKIDVSKAYDRVG